MPAVGNTKAELLENSKAFRSLLHRCNAVVADHTNSEQLVMSTHFLEHRTSRTESRGMLICTEMMQRLPKKKRTAKCQSQTNTVHSRTWLADARPIGAITTGMQHSLENKTMQRQCASDHLEWWSDSSAPLWTTFELKGPNSQPKRRRRLDISDLSCYFFTCRKRLRTTKSFNLAKPQCKLSSFKLHWKHTGPTKGLKCVWISWKCEL